MKRTAYISDCGLYRYDLTRTWSEHDKPLLWIMLNPSTADGIEDDPTIRRCINFSQREAAGGIVVCNLFALRATYPETLKIVEDPLGPKNDSILIKHAKAAEKCICAWGTKGALYDRNIVVLRKLRTAGIQTYCLGLTKGGHPRHPLYLRVDTALQLFNVWEKS